MAVVSDTLSVADYIGGLSTPGSPVGVAERIWCNGTIWPNESSLENGRYIQYSVAPLSTNKLTVTSITLNIGELGSSNKFFANIYYSTDSTFATKTQLNLTTVTLSNAATAPLTTLSYFPGVLVETGMTFYVRIYPWYSASSTTPLKYVMLTNVVISGTTALAGSPSLMLMPGTLSFGTINVNKTKDLSFTLSGTHLNPASDSIRIIPPPGFLVSTTLGSGYVSYLTVPYSDSTLNKDTVFVGFAPSTINTYNDSISISGGGAAAQVIYVNGTSVSASTMLGIFVSTTGSDASTGTYSQPYLTIQKAIAVAQPGDSIFVRAGTYSNNTSINIASSGTVSKMIALYAYPPDNARPLLDFSSMTYSGSNRGIYLTGNYWHIKGLEIYDAGGNGMNTQGSYNIVEFCSFHDNREGGCQLGGGAAYNQFINCDSYFNYDSAAAGGNADGFSPKLTVGTGNYFYGCRSWMNSDDGYDGYLRPADDVTTTYENCWAFKNGYIKIKNAAGSDSTTGPMNGNGFKTGGSDTKLLRHNAIVKNCLSFLNKAKGFDQNSNLGSITFLNCTGYQNGIGTSGGAYNFSVPLLLAANKVLTVENCISHAAIASKDYSFGSQTSPVFATNSWMSPFVTPADSDFISVDTTGVTGSRKADGSLPDITFMHLKATSQFVNRGTDVGLSYIGTAPDLGCFETSVLTGVVSLSSGRITECQLHQNYPNPFNPSTKISFTLSKTGFTTLAVYNVLGQKVATLLEQQLSAGEQTVPFDASRLSSGVYFYKLQSGNINEMKKMVLMK
jgi:hypothetical protein